MRIPLERRAKWFYGLALVLMGVLVTVVWLGPLPPRVAMMSTGMPASDHESVAEPLQQRAAAAAARGR